MKAPLSWLKEYVDIDCTAEVLKDKLFSCGFEVEEMVYLAKQINKIVTCKILSIDKHPNADKLSVTQVDAGQYGNLQIIVTNPATLAESVSLHKACHEAHYLELNYNLYQYLQSRDRIHRLGLKEDDRTNYYIYINYYDDQNTVSKLDTEQLFVDAL